jgi:hypothetical protein
MKHTFQTHNYFDNLLMAVQIGYQPSGKIVEMQCDTNHQIAASPISRLLVGLPSPDRNLVRMQVLSLIVQGWCHCTTEDAVFTMWFFCIPCPYDNL